MMGKRKASFSGNIKYRILEIGMWVPSTISVPLEMLFKNFVFGTFSDKTKSSIDETAAFRTNSK